MRKDDLDTEAKTMIYREEDFKWKVEVLDDKSETRNGKTWRIVKLKLVEILLSSRYLKAPDIGEVWVSEGYENEPYIGWSLFDH